MTVTARRELFGRLSWLGGLMALGATVPAAAQTQAKRFIKRRPQSDRAIRKRW